jgi:hypothetical protein
MYRIDVCKSLIDFKKKEKEWEEFEEGSSQYNVTSSYRWLKTYLDIFLKRNDEEFGENKRLLVLFLYKDSDLHAIAPFVMIQKKYKGIKYRCIEFIGQQWGATSLDIIGEKVTKDDINLIFNYLYQHEKFEVLNLGYIPGNSQTLQLGLGDSHILSACPFADLGNFENFEDFREKIYSKNLKRNLKKAEHKMEKQNLEYIVSEERITEENFNEIIELSKRKLVDNKHSIYLDIDKREFVKKMCKEMNSNVIFCELNGVKVAYRLSFFYKHNKFSFDASYDREFNKMELGSFSIEASLKDSFSKCVNIHSEGTGVDFYKTKFMKNTEKIFTYTRRGNTLLSFVIYRHVTKYNKAVEQYFYKQVQHNTSH